MPVPCALIVDDEADIRELIELTLQRMGLNTRAASSIAEAKALLANHEFAFCITDMRLPDGMGISLVRDFSTELPISVITAYGNAEMAVESLKAGAFDFVAKPIQLGVLRKLVESALQLKTNDAPRTCNPLVRSKEDNGGLLGSAPVVIQLRSLIGRLARSQAPVHISGESGTGKELTAKLIHKKSPRGEGPFVPVNCGAIPTELMESEFFGHVKGAFTGAVKDKAGLFQSAEGGTLFLDEVADLPLHMQVKLLRAVQERAVRAVGSETEKPVNVRIISATHKNLAELVACGSFRQDLYYRLNVIEVRTPPLRERLDDIPLIADATLRRLADTAEISPPPRLHRDALSKLMAYSFPGNVRELENILERAITLCDGQVIQADDLQLRTVSFAAEPAAASTARPESMILATPPQSSAHASLNGKVDELELVSIREALEKTHWNKTKAAELLGVSFRSLRYRIKKLGIE